MTGPVTNDLVHPFPRTEFPNARVLEFDFPGLEIGVAEYQEGPTGCTVFSFGRRASVSIDVRGGSPDVSAAHREVIEAVCFAGGSLYGLEASAGAAAEFFAKRGHSTKWTDIALVSGAILFDYGRRANAIYPDKELGRAAVRAMRPSVTRQPATMPLLNWKTCLTSAWPMTVSRCSGSSKPAIASLIWSRSS